ncbi:MAG: ATP-binding cassette domain-containing protein [Actinomycetaceae bacterium]|nr:ATP-binding cassette domain-containing protein [Actinomycetaceae bacterium]
MAQLAITDLKVAYGENTIINGLSFNVEPGEIIALIGENGAGKSTVLKALAGFHPMTYSSFKLNGIETVPQSDLHLSRTYSVMDNFTWIRGFTLWDNYLLLGKGKTVAQIEYAMELFNVADLANRYPRTLSTGQYQRASLATLLMRDWDILFLDEPEQRLDTASVELVADILTNHLEDRCVLMASHSRDLIQRTDALELRLS